jgi:hypothetical protein
VHPAKRATVGNLLTCEWMKQWEITDLQIAQDNIKAWLDRTPHRANREKFSEGKADSELGVRHGDSKDTYLSDFTSAPTQVAKHDRPNFERPRMRAEVKEEVKDIWNDEK